MEITFISRKIILFIAFSFLILFGLIFIFPTVQADSLDTEAPSIPANLSCTYVSTTSVGLVWEPSIDNVGVTGYDLYNGQEIAQIVTGTSFSFSGLQPQTSYSFMVKAKDEAGNSSNSSNVVSVTTHMEIPENFTATPLDSMVTLKWEAVTGASAYYVIVDGNTINNGSSITYKHTGLSPNTPHTYKVKAIGLSDESEWSEPLSINTLSLVTISGTISTDTTWTPNNVYFVQSNLTVAQSAHLQILPGTVIRFFQMSSLNVYGKVTAVGTQDSKIVFTGYVDRSYGGPGGGVLWGGIYIGTTGEFNCDYSIFHYSGYMNYSSMNTIFYNEGKLIVKDSDLSRMQNIAAYLTTSADSEIVNCSIQDTRGPAIQVNTNSIGNLIIKNNSIIGSTAEGIRITGFGTGDAAISGNSITNCQKYPIYINLTGLSSSVFNNISDNSFSGNIYIGEAVNAIYIEGTVNTDIILPEGKYLVKNMSINQGYSMTLDPGVVLLNYYFPEKIQVNGVFKINGTSEKPVVITTYRDSDYEGAGADGLDDSWNGILINTTGELDCNYAKLKYTGYTTETKAIEALGKLSLSNSEIP